MSQSFENAFQLLMRQEGGFFLHKVEGDTGGLTFAGISRNNVPDWPGWKIIDQGGIPPTQMVRDFYWNAYWLALRCEELHNEGIASAIFSCAVNTSAPYQPRTAVRLVQLTVGTTPDGSIGPKTLAAINVMDPELFHAKFFTAQVVRYANIVNRNRSQGKFLLGWLNRIIKGLQ